MESILKFLAMGGYASYVWPALGLTAAVLAGLLITSVRTLRLRQAAVEALEADNPRRRARKR